MLNNAKYIFPNLNAQVVITPQARRRYESEVGPLHTWAEHLAWRFNAGLVVEYPGVTVSRVPTFETNADRQAQGKPRTQTGDEDNKREPADYCVHCNMSLIGRTRVGAGDGSGQRFSCEACHGRQSPGRVDAVPEGVTIHRGSAHPNIRFVVVDGLVYAKTNAMEWHLNKTSVASVARKPKPIDSKALTIYRDFLASGVSK